MDKQKILLIGSSGFAGNKVMQKINNDIYELTTLSRNIPKNLNKNTKNIIFDFDGLNDQSILPESDHMIICLGTPLKLWQLLYINEADMPSFLKVDKDYVIKLAKAAKNSGINNLSLISAIGANSSSVNKYLKAKGEVEEAVTSMGFNSLNIYRPSHICGRLKWERQIGSKRIDMFIGEYASILSKPLMIGPFRDFKGVDIDVLSQSIINNLRSPRNGIHYFTYNNF
jgi:nucleoside-diphosphate-sugar epimerase